MEEFHVAPETDAELQRLRKKDRLYIWISGIILCVMLVLTVGLYLYHRPWVVSAAEHAAGAKCEYNGGTSCCGRPRQVSSGDRVQILADIALAKFQTEGGHQTVTAKVTDYVCHIQIDIYNSKNKLIKSYGYQGKVLYEIK